MSEKFLAADSPEQLSALFGQLDGNITTGRAPGAAIPFALELIKRLAGEEAAASVKSDIVY